MQLLGREYLLSETLDLIGFHYTVIVIFVSKGHEFLNHIGSAFLFFVLY
ncbi:hypothetical protein N7582_002862 [Saccharomyces uvarum]|nr:hypothetical protein N7582_002862 [Saccharomyces uvarum]